MRRDGLRSIVNSHSAKSASHPGSPPHITPKSTKSRVFPPLQLRSRKVNGYTLESSRRFLSWICRKVDGVDPSFGGLVWSLLRKGKKDTNLKSPLPPHCFLRTLFANGSWKMGAAASKPGLKPRGRHKNIMGTNKCYPPTPLTPYPPTLPPLPTRVPPPPHPSTST